MAIAPSSIRSRIAAAIETLPGRSESPHHFDSFPPSKESGSLVAGAFAVGIGRTQALENRQRRAQGTWSLTPVLVRFTSQIKSDDQVASYDAALDDETAVVEAVHLTNRDPELNIRFVEATRSAELDGQIYVGALTFDVHHFYPL